MCRRLCLLLVRLRLWPGLYDLYVRLKVVADHNRAMLTHHRGLMSSYNAALEAVASTSSGTVTALGSPTPIGDLIDGESTTRPYNDGRRRDSVSTDNYSSSSSSRCSWCLTRLCVVPLR